MSNTLLTRQVFARLEVEHLSHVLPIEAEQREGFTKIYVVMGAALGLMDENDPRTRLSHAESE